MPTNQGLLKEEEMVSAINDKKVCELTNNLRHMFQVLYGVLDDNEIVNASLTDGSVKPDFFVTYKGIKKGISLKTGSSTLVHNEYLDNFINYLKANDMSDTTIETILLFHFGDGTTDGSGEERFEFAKLSYLLKDRIKEANFDLNKDDDFVYRFVERSILQGANDDWPRADAIYHGDLEYGVVATEKQIRKHIYRKDFSWMNALHIGPITLRPGARYVDKAIVNEKRRHIIQCVWPKLYSDVIYISKRYNS